MCLAQGPQRSDADEARTRGPSVSSQALNHCAPTTKVQAGLYKYSDSPEPLLLDVNENPDQNLEL